MTSTRTSKPTKPRKRAARVAPEIRRELLLEAAITCLSEEGLRGFTLHADTAVSLNARRPVPLIDPEVDLLSIVDLGPRTWVAPPPPGPPGRVLPLR